MPYYSAAVKTVDHFQISPPPGSVPATTIPLTVFDVPWLLCHQVQRVFFYNHPISTLQFQNSVIPKLTSSLSAALRYFYPFAGRLISAPRPIKPYILYSDGDSVSFTVAESTTLDFNQAASDSPNDVELLHPLLPKLPPPESKPDGTTVSNLLALKVTLFPGSGFCIGFEFRHVAADGIAFNHFVKSWAAISKSGGAVDNIESSAPCHDKELIKENRVLEDAFLDSFWSFKSPWDEESIRRGFAGKVRATFSISADRISRMKAFVTDKGNEFTKLKPSQPATAFAVTSAFIWSSLIKSAVINLAKLQADDVDDDKIYTYYFFADCRGRIEPKVPATYFGNCLIGVEVSLRRKDLVGDGGFGIATEEIAAKIEEMEREGPLRDAEHFFKDNEGAAEKLEKAVTVAGSPKLRVYETDFGWGRPRKSEPVHIDFSGSVYFSDPRDVERGGIEFGLALKKEEMDVFIAGFEQQLKQLREVD
ncbi:Coumaroyl-CoA:anthocyanidin 3-O-glucoside-6''-O-coumaroyltransferase 1 [Linum perenne]